MAPHPRRPLRLAAALTLLGGALTAQDPRLDDLDALLENLEREDRTTISPSNQPSFAPQQTLFQSGNFRLYDLSFDLLAAGGTSTERDEVLQSLQGGGHDPRKRGFTLQNAELALMGAVDPYFRAEVNLIYFIDPLEGESVFELEEAFATTTNLPYGLEVEAGMFFTEFGRINPRHPHAWDFIDLPVVNARFLGSDGIRAPGVRVGWLAPLPWMSEVHVGVQNANGETMASFLANDELFEERPVGGRPFVEREVRSLEDMVWMARWLNGFEVSETTTLQFGLSGLFGPNATGNDGRTSIYGADLLVRWNDGQGGFQAKELTWQSEFLYRDYEADSFFDAGDPTDPSDDLTLPADRLEDWGFYSQLLYRYAPSWRAGVRVEHATGSGSNFAGDTAVGREDDPFRSDRTRISSLLQWQQTHFSRLRLQYNYDEADFLSSGEAHSVWLGVEVAIGPHAAHGL